MKYSIVIPTFNHLSDLLIPCVESIFKNTDMDGQDVEIIVVANGCNDGTEEWVKQQGPRVKLLSFTDPLGYTRATNMGITAATGEFVVLMNNDCQILDYAKKGEWLDMLRAPFDTDIKTGVTGPSKLYSKEVERDFLIFFLVMIKKDLFGKIGLLDEIFSPGGGEDIDFCARADRAGYKIVKVPTDGTEWTYQTSFPIYHKGEATVHVDVDNWEEKFKHRMDILTLRRNKFEYSKFADVTCEISTKGRYFTTLPLAILAVINQELKPKRLIVFQDDQPGDLRENPVYKNLFILLSRVGIDWSFLFGDGKGQVKNHQKVLEIATTEWIWRLDDDNAPEPDVLRKLMSHVGPKVGAVGGSVVEPGFQPGNMPASTSLPNIKVAMNMQWIPGEGSVSADHLYSSFVYRKSAGKHGYCSELSPVGHREETIFTYEMRRAGWNLIIDRSAITWHMRNPQGGIRSYDDVSMWQRDEAIFDRKLSEWNVKLKNIKWCNLDAGIGDQWMFKMALPDILKSNPDVLFNIATAHPKALEDIVSDRIKLFSIADGINVLGEARMSDLNIYAFCMRNNWKSSIMEAFKKLYN